MLCERDDLFLQFTAVDNRHRLRGFALRMRANLLHCAHNFETVDDLAKHDVFAVEPARLDRRNEELRAVRVGTSVGHRQQAGHSVLQLEVFVGKLGAIDAHTASAVVVREVATLAHLCRWF